MNHEQHNIDIDMVITMTSTAKSQQQDLKFTTAGDVMKEYDPQSMIDSINRENERQSVERVYGMRPTGGETWQRGSRMVSQQLFPQDIVAFIEHNGDYFSDKDVLALLRGIDAEFTKRFGTDPYSRLIRMKMEKKDD